MYCTIVMYHSVSTYHCCSSVLYASLLCLLWWSHSHTPHSDTWMPFSLLYLQMKCNMSIPTTTGYAISSTQFQKHQATPCKTRYAFPCSSLGWEFWSQTLLFPLADPRLVPYRHNFKSTQKWAGPIMPRGHLIQGTMGCNSASRLAFGHFSSPTNIPTHSSYIQ